MLVNANHIKLTLNGRAILRDVSVHIEQGEIYGLLGPNGAGKSTTIAVLLGQRLCRRIGIIDRGRSVAEGGLPELLGAGNAGLRFRLRMVQVPPRAGLPPGIELVQHDTEWWHLAVAAEALPHLPRLWEDLIEHGWGYTEIHAEGGGLETLYLRLTKATDNEMQEQAA